jgi:hypothetical protein
MAYKLPNDLWFCQVGEHLIFLDVRGDRYFQLPPPLEREFISYLQGGQEPDVTSIAWRGLLRDLPSKQEHVIHSVVRSALEQAPTKCDIRLAPLLEISATIASVRLQLKVRPLKDVLARMCC